MTIQTTIPHHFLGGEGHGNPSIAPKLQHTWGNHHEQRGEAMEMGKTERGEESQLVFGEDRRRRALVALLFSSLPLPLLSFVSTAKGVAAQVGGDGFRVGRGRGRVL